MSTFLFICSTTSNLSNFKPQKLQPQKRVQNEKKKQNRRPQPRKHPKDSTLAPLFSALCDFFLNFFRLHQRVPFSIVSIFCNTMDVKKFLKDPPFYIFRHCDTVQKSHLKFLWKYFHVSKRSPFIF